MKAVIILNGEPISDYSFESANYIIATDGALNYAKRNYINVDKTVGDFDSLGYVPNGEIAFPSEKDYTDGEIALRLAVRLGYNEVDFVCAGGYREDHFLGNLALLNIADELGIKARAITAYSEIYYVKDKINVSAKRGTVVSVVAPNEAIIESSVGLKYQYNETELGRASTLGISNIAIDDFFSITFKSGEAYVFVNVKRN